MQLSGENGDEVARIGKLILYKNALIFGNTAYQISNISSIWIADHSYTIKHKLPMWVLVAAGIGLLAIVFGVPNNNWLAVAVGAALLFGAHRGYRSFKPTTAVSKYALGIELNSGRSRMFAAEDQQFVQKAGKALLDALAEKNRSTEKIVMNFDNKSINIENAIDSTIIGGDVKDSLVENV